MCEGAINSVGDRPIASLLLQGGCCCGAPGMCAPYQEVQNHGRTDHLEARALPEGPGSVGGPMRCPWYLFHRLL
ncbi:unnamed protein product [Staurois parvus]|uniref:Uncharacterized protein n=1 Tax=Staurois parvus TaxID=386267 RepID=A0ABN9CW56_9NEOB|nr:unnamed protein product [Staurois parvus]